jgi:hypothetical protein
MTLAIPAPARRIVPITTTAKVIRADDEGKKLGSAA